MGFAFNPFTGNFDQKGSGGGASYIDGEEAVYGDLSLDAGVAPLNSAWLVRSSSGIWPFNKPGGIYIRTATGGVSRDADYTYAGTMPDVFSDAVLTIYDEASTTRTGQFNLGSVTAGQNRVLTWPDTNGTIARTEDFASPPAIGNTTPNSGAFTTLNATGTTELVNGDTTAGPFRIYNTSSSANANYERGFMRWSSNVFQIGTEAGGTGSNRNLEVRVGTVGWTFATSGALTTAGNVNVPTSGNYFWQNRGRMYATADGVFVFAVNADGNFGRLCFGGTTSSFPALKRSSTTLQVRLANDSDFAPFECAGLTLNGNLTASTRDIVTDTTTGTKIGTATTQKIGFFNATPVVQQAAIADATDAATTQARLNDLLATMRTFGLIAT